MQQLGTIVRVQVQRTGLTRPADKGRYYDPEPLLAVAALRLTSDGVVGLAEAEEFVDVHNRLHPDTKNADVNAVSIGFSTHYVAMRERFGSHLVDGIAGENILVEASDMIEPRRLQSGAVVRTRGGELVELEQLIVAEPCVEFTRFALCDRDAVRPAADVNDGLRFLRAGMRGFYASYAGSAVVLRPGDTVFARD
jgi:hypothetical protein